MLPPFIGPKWKLDNAVRHARLLAQMLSDYISTNPFSLDLVDDPNDSNKNILQLNERMAVPRLIPLCLGDTFHNLRTALDLMACDLVRIEGKSTDGVSFPFARNADGFELAIKRSNSSRMSVEAREMLKNIAPYYGGNDLLRGIHEFDVIDKHRLITPVYQSAFFESLIIRTPEGGAEYNYDCSYSGSYGWRFTKGSKIEHSGMRVEARFDSDGPTPFAGTPILPALEKCAKIIHHTIASFEALYPKNT